MPMTHMLCSSGAQDGVILVQQGTTHRQAEPARNGCVRLVRLRLCSCLPKLLGMPDIFKEQRSGSQKLTMHRMQTPGHVQTFYNSTPGVAWRR